MTILPVPTQDEIAAILVALGSAASVAQAPKPTAKSRPSRWRMAGRDYASGSLR